VTLGRVLRTPGGRAQILLHTGEQGVFAIAGRIAFDGRSSTKMDRDNCVVIDDFVVVDGMHVVAKLTGEQVYRLQAKPSFLREAPDNFFLVTPPSAVSVAGEGETWEFARTGGSASAEGVGLNEMRGKKGDSSIDHEVTLVDIDAI